MWWKWEVATAEFTAASGLKDGPESVLKCVFNRFHYKDISAIYLRAYAVCVWECVYVQM